MSGALARLLSRVVALMRRQHHDSDLDEELDSHFAMLVDEQRRRGLSEDEARRAAHLTLGNATQLREAHRGVRGLPFLEELIRDVRYALRGFRRQPGFTAIAVLTLAVGIGANAAVFSIVNGVLMRPLAYGAPEQLMSMARGGRQTPSQAPPARWISLRRWEAMKEARSFEAGVYRPAYEDVILGGREPEALRAGRFSANVLSILRVRPILGREFRPEEDADGAPPVVLISERLWTGRFGASRSMVGQTISIGSVPHTVIGILPDGFQFPARDIDVWFPQPANVAFVARQYHACCSPLMGVARLRSGVTREQAEAELSVLNTRYEPPGQRRVDAGAATSLSAQGRHRRPYRHDAVDAAGRGRLRAADRLRERRHAADGACDLAGTGVRAPHGARRWPGPTRSSARHREPGALDDRRRARSHRGPVGVHAVATMTLFELPTCARARRQRDRAVSGRRRSPARPACCSARSPHCSC